MINQSMMTLLTYQCAIIETSTSVNEYNSLTMACIMNAYIQYEEESCACGYYFRTDGNWLPSATGEWFHVLN